VEQVSVIIPAYNEESRIENTLRSLHMEDWIKELIVVDDGSTDQTVTLAKKWTNHVIRLPHNVGKALALQTGYKYATSPILLFLDADLEESTRFAKKLVEPVWRDDVDMTIAVLPAARNGGFGLVKQFAAWGIYYKTGRRLCSPLSGQRAIKKDVVEACYQGDRGFGIEVGLSLDFLLAGYTIEEVPIPFTHRETGKRVPGFLHRMKQGVSVCQALLSRR
jgi:glycosyltransferase involved in cell wall biosynthesis